MFSRLNQPLVRRRIWRIVQIFMVGLCLVLAFGLPRLPSVAQQITQAAIIEILDSDQVFIQNRKARRGNVVTLGQQVRTGQARAGLRFNNNAVLRLGRNSSLIVGSQCVQLRGGLVVVSGTRGCVGSVIAVTRGTIYTLEMDERGQGQIKVLEGQVEVSNLDNPQVKPVILNQLQKVIISPTGEISAIAPLTAAELEEILTGELFEGFQVPLPSQESLPIVSRVQGFTRTFLRDALGGTDTRFDDFDGQKGEPSIVIVNPSVTPGIFTRTGDNTANFIGTDGTVTNISVDFDNQTITIDGNSGVANSLGLSGNNASGTVVNADGTLTRIEVFGVELEEPPVGQIFSGTLTTGIAPDR
jgi:hypothetical protein